MKVLVLGFVLGLFWVPAFAQDSVQSVESVICGYSQTINVYDDTLSNVITRVPRLEEVRPFQSWNQQTDSNFKSLQGIEFSKVQFETTDKNDQVIQVIGWVPKSEIKSKSECPEALNAEKASEKSTLKDLGKNVTSLSGPNCCLFPLRHRPTASYTSGMRRFGAGRSGGRRIHAAADLYQSKNAAILSVAPGKAISGLYFFYQGTYAIEVKHSGGFVVRYGELTGKKASGVRSGSAVKAGQEIGYMGKVNSGCCSPMLHFELYKGSGRGPLTTGGRGYQRRSDLINPTKYLLSWEEKAL